MCEVATIGLVIGAATGVASATQDRSNRKKAQRFQDQKQREEEAAARAAHILQTQEVQAQLQADAESAQIEIEVNRRSAHAAIARSTVIAGEAGAFGLSFQGLIDEFARTQAEFEGQVNTNLALTRQSAALRLRGAELNRNTRLNNAQRQRISQPNYVGHALTAVQTGLSLGSSIQRSGLYNPKATNSKP